MRHAPNADKQPARCECLLLAGIAIGKCDLAENLISLERRYFGMSEDTNVGRRLDAVNQVMRHRLLQRFFQRYNPYSFGESREVQRGLPGRVTPAHHENIFI